MTSEAPAPRMPVAPEPPPRSAKRDEVIDEQLQKTQRQVKGVDIAAGLLILGIGVIGYLFALALADHWLVAGGLSFGARLVALVAMMIVGGTFAFFNVMRPLLQKINPVFVAHTIEQSQPSLKNSLVNFLLIRSGSHGLSAGVYQAVEGQAASDLAKVSPEAAVDRRHVVWLASAFVALIAIGGIYHIASPKSPLTSAVRIALPWTDMAAPTRVTITEITPGDTAAFNGDTITVSAEVSGAALSEAVTLSYDTADGQSVAEAIPMRLPEGGYRYRCELPPGKLGLQQDVRYYIAAGDCISKKFNVTVQTPPVIEVERIDYKYPKYTGIANRSVERQGDIRGIEGTEITIFAKANRPIQKAEIDLNCDGLRGLRMRVDGDKANGRFKLRMRPGDSAQPEHDSYLLQFSDEEGRENRRPIRYEIEVIADLPPVVRLVNPPRDHIELPANSALPLEVEAEDADFSLRKVTIRTELSGRGVPIRAMMNKVAAEEPHKGPFAGTYSFEPAKLGLKAGDHVVYWAEAADSKTPLANVAETERRWIMIVEPSDDQEQQPDEQKQQDQPKEGESGEGEKQDGKDGEDQKTDEKKGQEGDKQEGEGQKGESQEGKGQEGEDQKGEGQQQDQDGQKDEGKQESEKPSEPIDGDSNPGDVFDKALEHIKEQEKKEEEQGESKKDEQTPGEDKKGEPKEGEQKGSEDKKGEPKEGEQKGSEDKKGEPKEGEQKGSEDKKGEPKEGEQKGSEDKKGEPKEGEQKGSEDKKGEPKEGEQKGSEDKKGEPKEGEQKGSEDKKGEPKEGEQKGSEDKKGEAKEGGQKGSEDKKGEAKEGEQKGGEDKQGESKPGEEKQGEPKDQKDQDAEKQSGPGKDGAPSGKMPSDQSPAEEPAQDVENEAAEAFNKEYSDKATDLVLEEFEKQLAKQKPDQELLDSLGGWSREDLERFTKRWRAMKKAAKEGGAARAKHDLDDALRSLGLGPSKTRIGGSDRSDDMKQLREQRRIAPPKKWARFIEATKRGVGSKKGRDEP